MVEKKCTGGYRGGRACDSATVDRKWNPREGGPAWNRVAPRRDPPGKKDDGAEHKRVDWVRSNLRESGENKKLNEV